MALPVPITWIGSDAGNYTAGNWRKRGAILHWMAGALPGTTSMFRPGGSANYATSYGIGTTNGKGGPLAIHQYVADKDRAFGSANGAFDRLGISTEIENDYYGAGWPASKPTARVHDLVARFLAEKAVELDWRINGVVQLVLRDWPDHKWYGKSDPEFGVTYNVVTHRSMALKPCPGTTDVQWIVAQGNRYIAEILGHTVTPTEPEDPEMSAAEVEQIRGEIGALRGDFITISTREGRASRVYVIEDGAGNVVKAAVGALGYWTDLPAGVEKASVDIFATLGLSQNWSDRKRLDQGGFDYARMVCLNQGQQGDSAVLAQLTKILETLNPAA